MSDQPLKEMSDSNSSPLLSEPLSSRYKLYESELSSPTWPSSSKDTQPNLPLLKMQEEKSLDWVLQGVAQVMFVNNPISGLIIFIGLLIHNPWWTIAQALGSMVSTLAALALSQVRSAIASRLYGYNGMLVGLLVAVFSKKLGYYWWLLFPVTFTS
ncbi:mCG56246, partial [Mus musculus]